MALRACPLFLKDPFPNCVSKDGQNPVNVVCKWPQGVCGAGLKCLVRFNVPRGGNGRLQENEAFGECVSDTSELCPGNLLNKYHFEKFPCTRYITKKCLKIPF